MLSLLTEFCKTEDKKPEIHDLGLPSDPSLVCFDVESADTEDIAVHNQNASNAMGDLTFDLLSGEPYPDPTFVVDGDLKFDLLSGEAYPDLTFVDNEGDYDDDAVDAHDQEGALLGQLLLPGHADDIAVPTQTASEGDLLFKSLYEEANVDLTSADDGLSKEEEEDNEPLSDLRLDGLFNEEEVDDKSPDDLCLAELFKEEEKGDEQLFDLCLPALSKEEEEDDEPLSALRLDGFPMEEEEDDDPPDDLGLPAELEEANQKEGPEVTEA